MTISSIYLDVHAGSWPEGDIGYALPEEFHFVTKVCFFGNDVDKVPYTEIATLELATEENVKKAGGTIGWGLAGSALLGGVGLLAGLLLGGKKKKVTFIATFKDGRKLLASVYNKRWVALNAAIF